MVKTSMKVILFVSLLFTLLCGVSATFSCDGKSVGDYCIDSSHYASCPTVAPRACQAGLVCQQIAAGKPGVFCVWPEQAHTATAAPEELPECDDEEPTQAPTKAPTKAPVAPTAAATKAPTAAPTRLPPVGPTTRPPVTSTSAPVTQAPTKAPNVPDSSTTGVNPPTIGSWPNGPVKAIYIDVDCYAPEFTFTQIVDDGYNLVILAFFVSGKTWDCVTQWGSYSEEKQKSVMSYFHSKGARMIASTGGATDTPFDTYGGAAYGSSVATWAKNNNLDGMDFDLENFGIEFQTSTMNTAQTVQWVADATNAARRILGDAAIITHAPQPPYFGQHGWNDGYTQVYKLAPSINFLLVQFYNNGPQTTYETIFTSGNNGLLTTVQSIAKSGVIPMSKIVIGKPVHENDIGDKTNGYNTPQQLKEIFARAKAELGWNAGVMGWQYLGRSDSAWINSIYPKN